MEEKKSLNAELYSIYQLKKKSAVISELKVDWTSTFFWFLK